MKTQRGIGAIEIVIILVIVAAVGAGATAVVHTYNRALTENEQLKEDKETLTAANQAQLVENTKLKARADLLDKQTAERRTTDSRIAALERTLNESLGKIYAQSLAARTWAATPIPDDVRSVVRARAGAGPGGENNGARPAPAAVVKPDAGDSVPRPGNTQRGPAVLRAPVGVKPQ